MNQPPGTDTHASTEEPDQPARPDGAFDYGVIGVASAIVALSLYLAVRYLVWPGERDPSHIKRTIIEEES